MANPRETETRLSVRRAGTARDCASRQRIGIGFDNSESNADMETHEVMTNRESANHSIIATEAEAVAGEDRRPWEEALAAPAAQVLERARQVARAS